MPKRHNAKGRSIGLPPFVQLPHYLIDSTAYASLSCYARATLIEVIRRYNGHNNGCIPISCREVSLRIKCSKGKAQQSLKELATKGFIMPRLWGHFNQKQNIASEYALTFFRCDKTGEVASKNFMRWKP